MLCPDVIINAWRKSGYSYFPNEDGGLDDATAWMTSKEDDSNDNRYNRDGIIDDGDIEEDGSTTMMYVVDIGGWDLHVVSINNDNDLEF